MSCFSFFYVGSDALPHLPMPTGYHFSRKNTAAETSFLHHQNTALLHITLLHPNKCKTSELSQNHTNTVLFIFFYFSGFSFCIYPFLSLFSLFFTHTMLPVFLCIFFCFCERGSGGVWPAGVAWARQRGVWPANCVHSVSSERAEAVHGQRPCTAQFGCSHQPARKTAFCLLFLTAAGKLVCMVGCALF